MTASGSAAGSAAQWGDCKKRVIHTVRFLPGNSAELVDVHQVKPEDHLLFKLWQGYPYIQISGPGRSSDQAERLPPLRGPFPYRTCVRW